MSTALEIKERICIAIDAAQLRAVDKIAAELERSRSWVFAQAVSSFLAPHGGEHESGPAMAPDVAGRSSPRKASPGCHAPGEAPFSEKVDA